MIRNLSNNRNQLVAKPTEQITLFDIMNNRL